MFWKSRDYDETETSIGNVLIQMGLINAAQLHKAITCQRDLGGTIGDVLIGHGMITEKELAKALEVQAKLRGGKEVEANLDMASFQVKARRETVGRSKRQLARFQLQVGEHAEI